MVILLQKIGNAQGIILDNVLLSLLKMDANGAFEVIPKDGGLFLKPFNTTDPFSKVAKKHRKSLEKPSE
jgi:hypothetical protein